MRYLVWAFDPSDILDEGAEVTLTHVQAKRLYEALKVEFAPPPDTEAGL